jgi:hypothetical protein
VITLPATSAFAQAGGAAPSDGERQADQQVEQQPASEVDDASAGDETPAQADESDAYADAADSSTSESKASQERTIPGGTLAIASYILFWLMTLGFVGVTARRQSALADELETLERRMDRVLGDIEDEV